MPRTVFQKNRKDATVEQEELNIDQQIFKERKSRRKNVALAWIDYQKVYNMVLQSWIIDCLKMYRISDKVIKFTQEAMKSSKMEKLWRVWKSREKSSKEMLFRHYSLQ